MCLQTKHHDWPDDTIPSGTTYFSKVRLSLRTLQIIEDDLQFAATTGRRSQTFGSAGDCYSTVPCPQGRFSINFERTKFRIRPKTEWETRGQNATMLYHAKVGFLRYKFRLVFVLIKKTYLLVGATLSKGNCPLRWILWKLFPIEKHNYSIRNNLI